MQDDNFIKVFKKLCNTIDPNHYKEPIIDIWAETLSKYDDTLIEQAINEIIRNFQPTHYKPFPVPADIIEIIRRIKFEMAREYAANRLKNIKVAKPPKGFGDKIKRLREKMTCRDSN